MIYKNIQEYSDDEIMNIIYNGNVKFILRIAGIFVDD